LCLDPCITIAVLDDLVRHLLNIALDLCVGELATDETLRREESVFWVDNGLTLGSYTNQAFTILGNSNN
jgi:NAD-specific glutamate dehydrogenase